MNEVTKQLYNDSSWFTGNIVPNEWADTIRTHPTKTKPNGSADMLAMLILADILYWYRPTIIRDEVTGKTIEVKNKFKADKLQKNYKSYADRFGMSKGQVKNSFKTLKQLNLIEIEFRTITSKSKLILSNVMFVEPKVENIKALSFQSHKPVKTPPCVEISTHPPRNLDTPISEFQQTYTKTTTKNTTQNTLESDRGWIEKQKSTTKQYKNLSDIEKKEAIKEVENWIHFLPDTYSDKFELDIQEVINTKRIKNSKAYRIACLYNLMHSNDRVVRELAEELEYINNMETMKR